MAVFSVNQATHLYKLSAATVAESGNHIYFNAENGLRSDLIEKKNILSVTSVNVAKLNMGVVPVTLTLNNVALEDTKVIPGEYVVRFVINNYYGPSMYDGAIKHAAVFVGANMTQEDFFAALKKSIETNLKREIEKPFEVTADATSMTVTPVPTEWKLGTKAMTVPSIEILGIWKDFGNGFEEAWLTATPAEAATPVAQSGVKKLCDLEYFCLGERGDIYRNVGWPYVVETKGVLDATAANDAYDVVTIHYAYVGANESVQKSEKTMVLVVAKGSGATLKTAIEDKIKDKIKDKTE